MNLGVLAMHRTDDARAQALLEESLAISRRLGESWNIAVTLYKLGVCWSQLQNSHERAAMLLRESLALFRKRWKISAVSPSSCPRSRARIVAENGRMTENPLTLVAEGLALCRDLQDRYATLNAVELTAEVTSGATGGARSHRPVSSARRTACARRRAIDQESQHRRGLRPRGGGRAGGAGRTDIRRGLGSGRARCPSTAIIDDGVGRAAGSEREPALPVRARAQPTHVVRSLTRREREVLGLLANGLSNRDIARELSIGERTARFHVTSILGKLGVRTRGQAVAVAMRQSLIG